jgi:predicted dehydrogenase
MQNIRWGIIGCGAIAETFVNSFRNTHGGSLIACAASLQARAQAFAHTHNIEKVHDHYQALVSDPEIDAVYIATTHNFHFEHIMLCLKHNKHVLCEKPLTVNAEQAKHVQALALEKKRLVVEAVWTRFLPAIKALQKVLSDELIGKVKSIHANFSLNRIMPDEHRLLNPALAGGALLDLGIYPLSLAHIVMGKMPINARASAIMSRTGVDEISNYFLEYDDGVTALLSSGFRQSAPCEAKIYGELGYIEVPQFLGAQSFTVYLDGETPQVQTHKFEQGTQFSFEIQHMHECIGRGLSDSPIMPMQTSVDMMTLMDELRAQFGLVYEADNIP